MANVDRANGFTPVGTFSGAPWQGSVQRFDLDATHAIIGVGDLVQMTSDGYPDIYAATEISLLGVVVGVNTWQGNAVAGKVGDNFLSNTEPSLTGYAHNAVALNTAGVIYVCTAPDVIMEAQEDAISASIALADRGANIEIINTGSGPNTTTGISTMELNSDTVAQTATLPLKLLDLVQRPDNVLGATGSPGARWLVTPTVTHYYRAALGL